MFEKLFRAFVSEGRQLFFVGGYVRDKLLGKDNVADVDFATDATPEDTIRILKKNNLISIPIGIEFGTIQTEVNNIKVEITTFRCEESYTKGSRKPAVRFGRKIEEDLARRDFTFNAIAMREDCSLIDPFSGFKDLLGRCLRTPIYPYVSFSDDPLRMLRACRFVARFAPMNVEWNTFDAMCNLSERIKEVSSERIFQEVSKILMTPDPTPGLELMETTGLLGKVFPELQKVVDFKQNQGKWHSKRVWPHTLQVVDNTPVKLNLRWSALFHDIAKPQTYSEDKCCVHFYGHDWKGALVWDQIAIRLRVSKEFQKNVHMLIYEHLQPALLASEGPEHVSDTALRRFIKRIGENNIDDLFALSLADITSHNPDTVKQKTENCLALKKRIKNIISIGSVEKLKLPSGTGTVISEALNIKPGRQLGEIMKCLTEKLIDGEILLTSDFVSEARKIIEKK